MSLRNGMVFFPWNGSSDTGRTQMTCAGSVGASLLAIRDNGEGGVALRVRGPWLAP